MRLVTHLSQIHLKKPKTPTGVSVLLILHINMKKIYSTHGGGKGSFITLLIKIETAIYPDDIARHLISDSSALTSIKKNAKWLEDLNTNW